MPRYFTIQYEARFSLEARFDLSPHGNHGTANRHEETQTLAEARRSISASFDTKFSRGTDHGTPNTLVNFQSMIDDTARRDAQRGVNLPERTVSSWPVVSGI